MNPKPVVGSGNQFDSDTYLVLVTTDTLIQATEAQLNNGAFSTDNAPLVKNALNDLIKAYDIAQPVYLAYHTAALGGTSTPAQQNVLKSYIANVNTATTTLVTIKGAK